MSEWPYANLDMTRELIRDVNLHIEMMAAAYLKATDIPPEDCELVAQYLPDQVVYRFQRRKEGD
jgi:hypothetical protein